MILAGSVAAAASIAAVNNQIDRGYRAILIGVWLGTIIAGTLVAISRPVARSLIFVLGLVVRDWLIMLVGILVSISPLVMLYTSNRE
jgi:hypothetical protein